MNYQNVSELNYDKIETTAQYFKQMTKSNRSFKATTGQASEAASHDQDDPVLPSFESFNKNLTGIIKKEPNQKVAENTKAYTKISFDFKPF